MSQPKDGPKAGLKAVADMLNLMTPEERNRILANVAEKDPKTAQALQKQMFTFEDLLRIGDRGMQVLVGQLPRHKLAIALRKASEELKTFFFRNQSKKAQELLQEEIDSIGPRKLSEVQATQNEIIQLVKKLILEGMIILPKDQA